MSLPSSTCSDTITIASAVTKALTQARAGARRTIGGLCLCGRDADDIASEWVANRVANGRSLEWAYRAGSRSARDLIRTATRNATQDNYCRSAYWTSQGQPTEATVDGHDTDLLDLRDLIPAMPSLLRETVQWWMANGGNRTRAARDMGVSPPTYAALFNQAAAWLKERLK